MFSISYLLSPKFCHRFVGYLEEEAVKTYTKCLEVSTSEFSCSLNSVFIVSLFNKTGNIRYQYGMKLYFL